jgi:hypothetical protein
MPANVEIDPTTVVTQSTNYELTAFQTEDGDNHYYLNHFSWAGGARLRIHLACINLITLEIQI